MPHIIEQVTCTGCDWGHEGENAKAEGQAHHAPGHEVMVVRSSYRGVITGAKCGKGWDLGRVEDVFGNRIPVTYPWGDVNAAHAHGCDCPGPLHLELQDGPDDEPFTVLRNPEWTP